MFLLEPVVGKMMLPFLGGSPNVWNTCVLFFQTTLLFGYGYAHWADKLASDTGRRKGQIVFHVILMWLPALLLPMRIPLGAPRDADPCFWLLGTLSIMCGAIFFAISTTAPLLQKWYFETKGLGSGDPYFLYALSNAGGMIGLCSYPFFFEPTFTVAQQNRLIQILYLSLAVLISICAVISFKGTASKEFTDKDDRAISTVSDGGIPKWGELLLLTFIPSSLTLGLTTYVTSEMSPLPLFWVAPLFIYLVSFVIAFSRLPAGILKVVRFVAPITAFLAIANVWICQQSQAGDTIVEVVNGWTLLHLLVLGFVALACHGTVAAQRPSTKYLSSYYFVISLGGVLGSLFNAILAPSLFKSFVEYPLVLVLSVVALTPFPLVIVKRLRVQNPILIRFGLCLLFAVCLNYSLTNYPNTYFKSRNFFGSLSVRVNPLKQVCELWNGATMHGAENMDPGKRGIPISYYHQRTPIGQLMKWAYSDSGETPMPPYAVIGLGPGAMAAYAHEGQVAQFYEINPQVTDIASNPLFFTYVYSAKERKADIRITSGDGRLEISKAPSSFYKVIVIDAFSSDTIPTHLITKEAVQTYMTKLRKDGLLAVHITNNYYDLKPVLASLARESKLNALVKNNFNDVRFSDSDQCEWVVLTVDQSLMEKMQNELKWIRLESSQEVRVWTDDYCNPLNVLTTPFD